MNSPILVKTGTDRLIVILKENQRSSNEEFHTFQLYEVVAEWKKGWLNDLNNYIGLLTVNMATEEIFFTAGNDSLSNPQILDLVAFIKKRKII